MYIPCSRIGPYLPCGRPKPIRSVSMPRGAANPADLTVTYDAVYGTLPVPVLSGNNFAGWWTGIGGTGTEVLGTDVFSMTGNQTLFAFWEPVPVELTVTISLANPADATITFLGTELILSRSGIGSPSTMTVTADARLFRLCLTAGRGDRRSGHDSQSQ